MERRNKFKHGSGSHLRSQSFSAPSNDIGSNHMHRQATYDDSETQKMEVNTEKDVWMNSFSSWKMKRMKATSTERDRKAERDDVEETQEKLHKRKNKTFREIVEEKQRREEYPQGGSVEFDDLGAGEITNILADLPSTNLDSDNEQEHSKSPPMMEESMERLQSHPVMQERMQSSPLMRESMQSPPVMRESMQSSPVMRERMQSSPVMRERMQSPPVMWERTHQPRVERQRREERPVPDLRKEVEQNMLEPELLTTTDSRTMYSAPPPSVRPASEVITATNTRSTYAAPTPAVRSKSPPTARRREPEPVERPDSFHDKLLKARQYEKEAEEVQQKAKEDARKPYKPRKSSIMSKIHAFNTGTAFNKDNEETSASKVEKARKPDIEEDDFEDMVIIMSQRARSQQGFGFKTSGGYDERKPLVVSSVSTGSVADYSDLQVGDEILAINKESTRRFNQDDVHQCLGQSILTGKLTCKVRRYPDGKPSQNKTAVKEPVFQISNPSKQESRPPPVQSQPPPARQPVRTSQPPVERVTPPPKQEEPIEADVDLLRPGPTKNALAKARQMLDDLEMNDNESLASSSKSSDIVDSSSLPPANRLSNKVLYSQPIKTNGYLSHGADRNSMDDESVSSEDSRRPTQRHRPNPQTQERIFRHTPTSSQDEGSSQEFQPKPAFRSVSGPKPYQSKAPELYQPPSSHDVEEPTNGRSDTNHRRNEFFPDDDWRDKPLEELDNLWKQVEEPVVAVDEETSEMMPSYRPIKPSTAHRKPFNREEERKRLERWNEEQDRRRQEKHQQERQRLVEEQERTLKVAAEDVQRKRDEEERILEEKRRENQRRQEELKQIRERQMEEEENRRKARLEQERMKREEAERERREEERREEERRKKAMMERERIAQEAAEKDRLIKEKEENEARERERLQREREQRERVAREKMRKEQEEYANMLKEREREKQEEQRMRAEAEQKRQEEEEADHERQEMEKWGLENEERQRAAKLKAEQDAAAAQQEARRKFEVAERERIRAEERDQMRREWEEERKQDLEQLELEKEKLRKAREEMDKRLDDERRQLQLEMGRIKKEKELEQRRTPVIEVPASKVINGDLMSAPKQQPGMSDLQRNRNSPQDGHSPRNGQSPRTVSPGTQRTKENNQKNMLPERDQTPSHAIMSQYTDPNIPINQHWLIEEAERRRRAEDQGIERTMPPDVVIPPHSALQAPQQPTHSRHSKPHPRGYDQEIPTRLPAQRNPQSHEAPASTNAAQRRLRKPEAEAERQNKMQNRRSMPDLMGGKDDVVPHGQSNNPNHGGQATEPPISRSSKHGQHSIPGQGSAFQEPNKNIPPSQVISGKLQCCNCGKSLGRGAAMIIESLGLHYHVECFRCCVCSIRLGNGTKGTDVRIRASQLHCQNCYSNEAGFQYTEV